MANIIYEDERIIVSSNPTNQSRVSISDKFSASGSMSINREAFERMCGAVSKQIEQRKVEEMAECG